MTTAIRDLDAFDRQPDGTDVARPAEMYCESRLSLQEIANELATFSPVGHVVRVVEGQNSAEARRNSDDPTSKYPIFMGDGVRGYRVSLSNWPGYRHIGNVIGVPTRSLYDVNEFLLSAQERRDGLKFEYLD